MIIDINVDGKVNVCMHIRMHRCPPKVWEQRHPQYQLTHLEQGNKMSLEHVIVPESKNRTCMLGICEKDIGASLKGLPTGQIWDNLPSK